MTRYVPLLKGKQGEYQALSLIAPTTRKELQPLVEIVPSGEIDEAESLQQDATKLANKLSAVWAGGAAFIDASHLALDTRLATGLFMLGEACAQLEARGVAAIPTLHLDDPQSARDDVRSLQTDFGRGLCIRVVGTDLDDDGDTIGAAAAEMLQHTGVGHEETDLLLDAGFVDGDVDVTRNVRALRLLLRELPDVTRYRSITVAGGAFPEDLSEFPPHVLGQRQRYDADMWAQLVAKGTPRPVDYGDYAIANPRLPEGVGFRPAPQLRYTVDTSWLILKGSVKDPRGSEQFYDICEEISRDSRFVGAALGSADRRIADARSSGTGNPTTWRQIATTHHLDYVVMRLTNLGEP